MLTMIDEFTQPRLAVVVVRNLKSADALHCLTEMFVAAPAAAILNSRRRATGSQKNKVLSVAPRLEESRKEGKAAKSVQLLSGDPSHPGRAASRLT